MAKTLKLEDATARKLYPGADSVLKAILEETFGKEFFKEKLIDRINSLDDIYKELGRKKPTIDDYKHLPQIKRERALNTQYIDDSAECLNEGVIMDFTNRNQRKYYNYFERTSSGWVLSFVRFNCYGSAVGSGFYFKDEETSRFAAKLLIKEYNKVLE